MDDSFVIVVARVFANTIVPLAIGMAIRARREAWAVANEETFKRVALVAFLLVVAVMYVTAGLFARLMYRRNAPVPAAAAAASPVPA